MTMSGLTVFDDTIHTTNVWIKELMEELHLNDRQDAYRILRATLHVLRDRLPANAAASLAAQLPMLVRGFYYEGWRPGSAPSSDKTEDDIANHIAKAFARTRQERDPKDAARAVFRLLDEKISAGEVENVKSCLPPGIRSMWPN